MKSLLALVDSLRKQYDEDQTDELSESLQVHLAVAIAKNLCVPSESSTSGLGCWNQCHRLAVRKLLDEINELYIIDIPKVTDLIRETFVTCHDLVHNPQNVVDVVNLVTQNILKKRGEESLALRPFNYSLLNSLVNDAGQTLVDFVQTEVPNNTVVEESAEAGE